MGDDPDRRKFLKVATCALGGGVGVVVAAPVVRLVIDPAGKQTVTSPRDPIDIGSVDSVRIGEPPKRVEVIAPVIKDAWSSARDVVLGAAWLRRIGPKPTDIDARSAVCPHLGCAVGYDAGQKNFLCPCHDSRFDLDGKRMTGPSKRGLDRLEVTEVEGRLKLAWVRFKLDTDKVEPA
ncbi:MAG TPA: Rieske 2Fe-2S domain-containing protein [Kofleriaceae bacterium]|nr:Rieske 2Fe-2S domain-containing protein [Kofleriaceae bacterium]